MFEFCDKVDLLKSVHFMNEFMHCFTADLNTFYLVIIDSFIYQHTGQT
jgi:hypothetical protein